MTKSMARKEAEASELSAVRQENMETTYRLDVLERRMGDLQEQMNRMETLLQGMINPQTRVNEKRPMQDLGQPGDLDREMARRVDDLKQIVATGWEQDQVPNVSIPDGNLNFPSTDPSVVVTGWGEDPLPHACTASPTLNNLNPTTAARGVSEEVVPEQGERFNHPITISYPSTHNLPKDIMPADLDWLIEDKHVFIEGVVLNTLDKQIRHFTGSGNTPRVYPLKPVIEEIQKSDLAQLYVVGRADKRLRCIGLFWKLPPWPDFCAMSGDSFAQHCGYEVIESFYSVKQYNHSVLDYPDKFEELVKIWLFVNETALELTKTSIEPVFEQYRLLVIASLKFSKLTLGTVAPQFTGILIIGDCKVESSAFHLNTEDTISETRYPTDNWNSCQFALSNGLPVLNNQSVPQSGHEYLEDIIDTGARELELKEFLLSVMKEVKDNHMLNQCYLRSGQTLEEWVCPTDKLCIFANVRGERIISMDVKCCYIVADESVLRLVEKLHLGEYEWNTYSEAFNRACNFASGIVKMGHQLDSRADIFSDTRAEWIIAAQGCFRQNLTIVTIYASLGEVVLVHSLNETQVSTLRCDSKQLKKLPAISSKLQSVRHFIYIEDEPVEADTLKQIEHLTTLSSSEVEEFGKTSHTTARLPSSTGLPKGVMIIHGNMVATTAAVMTIVPKIGTGDVHLAYFPLAHALELAAETVMLASGVAIGYGSALTKTDTRAGEAERGITIKSIGISLCYEMTEESLKSYKSERIRPVPTVNKMDIYFLELQVKGEEAYQIFSRIMENANAIIATNEDLLLNDVQDYPVKETVAFFTGFHVWAFTLSSLAKIYASKFGVDESKMMERLRSENFFVPISKKWTTKNTGSAIGKRGFVQFCYEPIKQIIKTPEIALDDICTTAIKHCDPEGYLMLYVPKWIPGSDMRAKYEELVKAATTENEVHFVETNDGDMAKILFPGVAFEEQFLGLAKSQMPRLFDGAFEEKAIIQFVDLNKFSLITAFTELNSTKVYAGPIKLQVFTFAEAYEFEDFESMLQEVATGFKTKVMFIYVDNLKFARIDASINEHPKWQKLSMKNRIRFFKEMLQIADVEKVPNADNSKFAAAVTHMAFLMSIFTLGHLTKMH